MSEYWTTLIDRCLLIFFLFFLIGKAAENQLCCYDTAPFTSLLSAF